MYNSVQNSTVVFSTIQNRKVTVCSVDKYTTYISFRKHNLHTIQQDKHGRVVKKASLVYECVQ